MLLLLAGFSFMHGPKDLKAFLYSMQDASLLNFLSKFRGIGSQLNPVDFQGP